MPMASRRVCLFTRERIWPMCLPRMKARRIASNIAKLPTLLGKALPDDAVNNLSDARHEAEDTRRNRTKHAWDLCRMEQEMRPPFEVELWKPVEDTPHLLAVTASFEAAEKAYQEAVANLRVGEVVRLRDAVGTLLLSTDANE